MKPPTRLVCRGCLRSIELISTETGQVPVLCPTCGGTIDSRLAEHPTPTSHYTAPLSCDPTTHRPPSWGETWTKGSFGAVGRFQIREMIGGGGFGWVFKAYDPRLDRDVALKVLKEDNPSERVMQRFFREARAAARLCHERIVGVHDSGCDDGRCWIAYELIEGRTLSNLVIHRKLDVEAAVRITRDLADALDHAHQSGIVHRDLKPANVLIDAKGNAHLIDFGLARRGDLDSDLTRDGAVLGTPGYMPPEVKAGQSRTADERSDIYSLGVMLYELLCGRRPEEPAPPFQDPAAPAPASRAPIPLPRSLNREVPPALERIVMKALAHDPNERHHDALALHRQLERWLWARRGLSAFSHPLLTIVLGLAGSLLLIVALKLMLNPRALGEAQAGAEPPAPLFSPLQVNPALWDAAVPISALSKPAAAPTPPAAAPAPIPGSTPTPTAGPQLVGNAETKKLHVGTCSHLPRKSVEKLESMADAMLKGYRDRCGFCKAAIEKIDAAESAREPDAAAP